MSKFLLEVNGVSKTFPGVKALDSVDLQIHEGEIHGLMGENGAGKSTIIKILAGIYPPDSGSIRFNGQDYKKDNISESISRGISVIYQELCLVPYMNVYENIMLGFEVSKNGMYSAIETKRKAAEILNELQMELPLDKEVGELDIAVQQMVEIAKAFSRKSRLIIMDEPTSSLTQKEVLKLYNIIRNLKIKGVSTIFVSHKLEEVFAICDKITIFRDGRSIITKDIQDITRNEMVYAMVGREIKNYYVKTHQPSSDCVLEVKNINKVGVLNNINFTLNKGEVLGFTGLIGAGRTELAHVLFGLDTSAEGDVLINGKKVCFHSPNDAIANGLALVPENRKDQAILPFMSVGYNITLVVLKKFMKFIHVNRDKENQIINQYMKSLSVKASSSAQHISNLSGGNQQKVVFARWIATNPKILILDEPTRGIDVGAKTEIYAIIDELAKQGMSIIVISSELPEIINISDRIIVMRGGRIAATLNQDSFSQEIIMNFSLGGI